MLSQPDGADLSSVPGSRGSVKDRVLVIGLDSAPLSLLVPWMKGGHLPNLSRIFEMGSYGDLYSEIPVTPVAWSSIYTGKNPGKHGILGFRNHKPGTYDHVGVNSTLRDAKDVWEVAGSYGKKVVVVNTPLTYPPRPVNGYLVCGFMAPSIVSKITYPRSLGGEIKKLVPNYRVGTPPSYMKGLYMKRLHETIQAVGDVAIDLMRKVDWDLAFVVFKETDEVQHSFYDQPGKMLGLYKRVDRLAGEMLDLAGDGAYTFVVSDHGGEPVDKRFNVAEFLRREGLLFVNKSPPQTSSGVFQFAVTTMFQTETQWLLDIPVARKLLNRVARARARRMKVAQKEDGFYSGTVDWERTTAFISSGVGLRINLKGREPHGIVEPSDFEATKAMVAERLAGVKDPATGMPVFRYALPTEKLLSGSHLENAPDILCLPSTGYLPTESLASFDPLAFAAAHKSLFSRSTLWSGTHSPYGVIAMRGPGISKGNVSGATLEDVAPTILYALGLPIPEDYDGKVLSDAFTEEHTRAHPVELEKAESQMTAKPQLLAADEEREVEDRLKQLGYLG